ncbi:MAG: thymidine phosphorylase, partial [Planctomycetota bacterium]
TPPAQARRALEDHIGSGRAYQRYIAMIEAQGGTFLSRLETAAPHDVPSPSDGWVAAIDGTAIGNTIIAMGGGRRKLGDRLDHRVGIQFLSKIGDPAVAGQPLARVLCDDAVAAQRAVESVQRAFALSATPVPADRLIVDAE